VKEKESEREFVNKRTICLFASVLEKACYVCLCMGTCVHAIICIWVSVCVTKLVIYTFAYKE
jgi:hypothetical protein